MVKRPDRPMADCDAISRSLAEPAAFTVIFDRHFGAVYRYLRLRVGEQAEDLAGETFVRAFRGRHGYDIRRRDARPWLFAIATNVMHTFRTAEARHSLLVDRLRVDECGISTEACDADALSPELVAALEELSPEAREVLLLRAWADLSYAEIAETLGISSVAARVRLSRASSKIASMLVREGVAA
jgi:RNA polymerase sigma factor (sigma-70 family)